MRSSRAPPGQPSAREAGATETARDVRVGAQEAPDEISAMVLDHEEDWSLVDAEIVEVEPAEPRCDPPLRDAQGGIGEAGVECVDEAVPSKQRIAVLAAHRHERRDRDLRREWDRSADRGRRDGAVVVD